MAADGATVSINCQLHLYVKGEDAHTWPSTPHCLSAWVCMLMLRYWQPHPVMGWHVVLLCCAVLCRAVAVLCHTKCHSAWYQQWPSKPAPLPYYPHTHNMWRHITNLRQTCTPTGNLRPGWPH